MKKNNYNSIFTIETYLRWPLIITAILVLFSFIVFAIDRRAGFAVFTATALIGAAAVFLYFYSRKSVV